MLSITTSYFQHSIKYVEINCDKAIYKTPEIINPYKNKGFVGVFILVICALNKTLVL
jgi:hypothetical protein